MSFTRSANPIWFFDNLVGQPFDDTYYAFFLTNTLPYLPQAVYQDPNGESPWNNPLEFQPSSGLPQNLYFDPGEVYRIEFRQGPTQTAPLIYLVEDYVPSPVVNPGLAGQVAFYPFDGAEISGGQLDDVLGTATNDNASTGYFGEFKSSVIPSASAVSLTTATPANITSLSLTAGDWDMWGNVYFSGTSVTNPAYLCWISATSATTPNGSLVNQQSHIITTTSINAGVETPFFRASLASTTTIYLSAEGVFSAGTTTACGGIFARRSR